MAADRGAGSAGVPAPRRGRRLRWSFAAGCAVYGCAVIGGMDLALPFDVLINLPALWEATDARREPGAERTLVVLQHGLFRSHWSLWRLEWALEGDGYQVLNPGYPSTRGTIEDHAERLHRAIEAHIAAHGVPERICYVGHSMGGLVIEDYLRRPDARAPHRCVYIATPHRGAVLCDLRKDWWPYPLLMGTGAAMQISPSDPLHQKPIPFLDRSGTIVGDIGEGSESIPGHDDGTVGVSEASLAGVADSITLPLGHTAISERHAMLFQVREFLRNGRFLHGP